MKTSLFILLALLPLSDTFSQGPAGKWKLTQCYTESAGQRADRLADMYRKQPCLEKLVYIFSADNTLRLETNFCADVDPDGLPAFGTHWKTEGNTIRVFTDGDDADTLTFNLSVNGREMRWQMDLDGSTVLIYVFQKQA